MHRRRLVRTLAQTLALAAALTGCREPDPTAAAKDRPNIILVSIDTLRPDHLGAYGYSRPTSPALDAFAVEEAVLFEQAIAHAPSTLHSHASILTSLLPHHHGASWGAKTRLADGIVSVTEVLSDAGYATAAFTGGGQMDPIFGLDQGFDQYHKIGAQRFRDTVRAADAWLREHLTATAEEQKPFFLFLHTYETHHPYSPPAELLDLFDDAYSGPLPTAIDLETLRAINRGELEIDDRDLAHIVAAYDAEIRSMDSGFADLLARLRETSLYDRTLIVVTSDHGEEMGEHGTVGWHSHTLYDELLRVPLLVKYPDQQHAGERVPQLVRSIDIAPTMLGAVGIEAPESFSGVDLTPLVAGSVTQPQDLVAVARMDRAADRDFSAVRTRRWKLMPAPRSERTQRSALWLFDLESDPAEQWDTAATHRGEKNELEKTLEEAIVARKRWQGEQVAPTKSTLDDLRKLGYLD